MVRLCLDIVSSMEGRFPPRLQGGKGIPQGVIIYATEAATHVRREGAPMVDKKQISKLYSAAKLSETEQSVLEYLLNNIDTLDDIGIKPVAMACFTSMTTVIRLSKKLGYRGYREMMYDLKHLQHVSREMNQSFKDSNVHFVCHTGDVDVFIAALHRNRMIGVNGEGFSRIVAQYMATKLVGLGFLAVIQDFLETDQFVESNRNTLSCMMLISKSGQTEAILETARACHDAGITTLAFTGNEDSELAKTADAIFTIHDDHPMDLKNVKPNCFTGSCILAFEELLSICLDNLKQEGLAP